MSLTQEQIIELKAKLVKQVEHLPPDKKAQALEQIKNLSEEALESLLEEQKGNSGTNEVFRMIIEERIPSTKIEENDWILAVLDINPIAKGHTIIIPKTQIKENNQIPSAITKLAKKIGKRIVSKLKAKNVEIQNEFKFEEWIINIIPIYDKPLNLNSPRAKASPEELEKIASLLKIKKKLPTIRKKSKSTQTLLLKRRIP